MDKEMQAKMNSLEECLVIESVATEKSINALLCAIEYIANEQNIALTGDKYTKFREDFLNRMKN